MRSFFLSLFLLIFCSAQASAQPERVITREQLPAAAQQFLSEYFPSADIATVSEQRSFPRREYDVYFHNGTHIEFSAEGQWQELSSREALPQGIVPRSIAAYVSEHYPMQPVVHIERRSKGWEVELANGMEMKFDSHFQLIEIDD
jgi:hypothetical protein